jgi:hypothetical protein
MKVAYGRERRFSKWTKCSLVSGWVCLRPPTEPLHWVVVIVGFSCVSGTVCHNCSMGLLFSPLVGTLGLSSRAFMSCLVCLCRWGIEGGRRMMIRITSGVGVNLLAQQRREPRFVGPVLVSLPEAYSLGLGFWRFIQAFARIEKSSSCCPRIICEYFLHVLRIGYLLWCFRVLGRPRFGVMCVPETFRETFLLCL